MKPRESSSGELSRVSGLQKPDDFSPDDPTTQPDEAIHVLNAEQQERVRSIIIGQDLSQFGNPWHNVGASLLGPGASDPQAPSQVINDIRIDSERKFEQQFAAQFYTYEQEIAQQFEGNDTDGERPKRKRKLL